MLICYLAATFTVLLPEPNMKEWLQNKKAKQDECSYSWLVLGIRKLYNLWMLVRKPGQARKT